MEDANQPTLKLHQEDAELAGHFFRAIEHGLMPIIEIEEMRLIAAARELERQFRDQKQAVHQGLVEQHDAAKGRRPAGFYSKIQLFSKHRRGSLQIYWQDVHQTKGGNGPAYVYLRKSGKDGYNIAALRGRASYAADLVAEYEGRAQVIRKLWRDLMEVKRSCRNSLLRLPAEGRGRPGPTDPFGGHIPRSPGEIG